MDAVQSPYKNKAPGATAVILGVPPTLQEDDSWNRGYSYRVIGLLDTGNGLVDWLIQFKSPWR